MRERRITDTSWDLAHVVADLRASREESHRIRHPRGLRQLPSWDALAKILDGLRAALFPTHFGRPDFTDETIDYFVGHTLDTSLRALSDQVHRDLRLSDQSGASDRELAAQARELTGKFAAELGPIRALLVSDIQAAYAGDPAAEGLTEILLCYPGITAVTYYRIAHVLYLLGARLLARLISEIAHSLTGIDIHPGAEIAREFFIDHGTGVVIGETSIIGERVRLYQAVTLGAQRFPTDETGALIKGTARHPVVEDDVVIYAGATILGRVTIGRGSVIGGNVWLVRSVPAGSYIVQIEGREPAERAPR